MKTGFNRKWMVAVALVTSSCTGRGGAPAAPLADPSPCRDTHIDYDTAMQDCTIRDFQRPTPLPNALAFDFEPSQVAVAAGDSVEMSLQMTNTSKASLTLEVPNGCFIFDIGAYRGEERVDYRSECGGLCGTSAIRVTLPPQGTLTKKTHFEATKTEILAKGCVEVGPTPLEPGHYTLRIRTPFHEDSGDGELTYADPPVYVSARLEVTTPTGK